MVRFLIILFLALLPSVSYAVDINRFSEKLAPYLRDENGHLIDMMGGRTELDILQREAESKKNNEAGLVGERLLDDMLWDTGIVSLIRTFVAELKLENDSNFNIHEHMDEFMKGITANYIPWFTKRADSYEEGIMLRVSLLNRLAAYEKAQAAGWKGIMATIAVRMVVIAPIILLIVFALFKGCWRTRRSNFK